MADREVLQEQVATVEFDNEQLRTANRVLDLDRTRLLLELEKVGVKGLVWIGWMDGMEGRSTMRRYDVCQAGCGRKAGGVP